MLPVAIPNKEKNQHGLVVADADPTSDGGFQHGSPTSFLKKDERIASAKKEEKKEENKRISELRSKDQGWVGGFGTGEELVNYGKEAIPRRMSRDTKGYILANMGSPNSKLPDDILSPIKPPFLPPPAFDLSHMSMPQRPKLALRGGSAVASRTSSVSIISGGLESPSGVSQNPLSSSSSQALSSSASADKVSPNAIPVSHAAILAQAQLARSRKQREKKLPTVSTQQVPVGVNPFSTRPPRHSVNDEVINEPVLSSDGGYVLPL